MGDVTLLLLAALDAGVAFALVALFRRRLKPTPARLPLAEVVD